MICYKPPTATIGKAKKEGPFNTGFVTPAPGDILNLSSPDNSMIRRSPSYSI